MNDRDIFDITKLEYSLVQQQIDKYDGTGFRIKAWTVTLWVTLFGWSLQFGNSWLLLVNCFAVVVFLVLDAMNKNYRQDYRQRRGQLAEALRLFGQTGDWPNDFKAPETPRHRPGGVVRQMFQPHVFLLYFPLIAGCLVAYFW